MSRQSKSNRIFSHILQPIRIVAILSLLTMFQIIETPWRSAEIIFYAFFIIFAASFVVELVFTSPQDGLRAKSRALFSKYMQNLPLEFVGVFTFAMSSLTPHSDAKFWLEAKISAITIGAGAIVEILHHYVLPRWSGKQITGAKAMVVIVLTTLMLFFAWLYIFFTANPQTHQ